MKNMKVNNKENKKDKEKTIIAVGQKNKLRQDAGKKLINIAESLKNNNEITMNKFSVYDERNLTMLIDFYELTMANGYFKRNLQNETVVFDMFYRSNPEKGGYVICAGLQQLIEYIQGMHFTKGDIEYLRSKRCFDEKFLKYLENFEFKGSISAVPEGTIVYPNTPLVTVVAPLIDAQLVETMILVTVNHQSMIATKANRIVRAAKGKTVMEFGARRAQGYDGAVYGARAAYIGGVDATATVLSDEMFGVPAIGTMAHSWVQYFDNEYEAFKAYAEVYPNDCSLLIDTYNVLKSGLPNAIKVAKEILEPQGKRLKGIRLDSGDLAYLSKACRKVLDDNEMQDCKIIVSNSIDEYLIQSLNDQGAKIDSYGVGERLITSKTSPVFGGVYKLVAVQDKKTKEFKPRIKVSENSEKITNPGYKKLYRCYDEEGKGYCDLIALESEAKELEEKVNIKKQLLQVHLQMNSYVTVYIDPKEIKPLHVDVFKNGKLVYKNPSLEEIREYVNDQLTNKVWEEELRFENPHTHFVDLTDNLYNLKKTMIKNAKNS